MGKISGIRKVKRLRKDVGANAGIQPHEVEIWTEALALETGSAISEVLVIADRVLTLSAGGQPEDAQAVLREVGDEFEAGELRYLTEDRPLTASCHPAQAMAIIFQTLIAFRPAMGDWISNNSQEIIERAVADGHDQASATDAEREQPFSNDWRWR